MSYISYVLATRGTYHRAAKKISSKRGWYCTYHWRWEQYNNNKWQKSSKALGTAVKSGQKTSLHVSLPLTYQARTLTTPTVVPSEWVLVVHSWLTFQVYSEFMCSLLRLKGLLRGALAYDTHRPTTRLCQSKDAPSLCTGCTGLSPIALGPYRPSEIGPRS